MAPVTTNGIDSPVSEAGQLISTVFTFGLAAAVIVWVVLLWRREGIVWPMVVTAGGAITCLMEPLFDHLYGLWFMEEGQWDLYATFGSNQPIWVPAAYVAFYGGAAVIVARQLAFRPTMSTVWKMYGAIVAMAIIAEISYVKLLQVYAYQDSQPFVVLEYPIFLGFTNAMAAMVGGIIIYRLVPYLRGWGVLKLALVVPMAFAMDLFGAGIFYLSIRHGFEDPSSLLTHLGALSVVLLIAGTVHQLGKILVAGSDPDRDAANLPGERVVPARD